MSAATPQDLHRGLQKAYNEDFPEKPLDIDHLMGTWENAAGKLKEISELLKSN
jgi:hypothetical protein